MMSKLGNSIFFKVVIALLALCIGLFIQQLRQTPGELPELTKAIILPTAKSIDSFDFIDHNSAAFTNQNLENFWTIAFFGFTNCPDICPTTMHTLKQIKARLDEQNKWGNYQVLMVSVDPARDTPEQLKKYVPFFDAEFIGVTGPVDKLTRFAKQLGILFVAREADEHGAYDVDHGTAMIVFNPKGQMAGVIPAPHKVDEISADLLALANYFHQDHATETARTPAPAYKIEQKAIADDAPPSVALRLNNAWIRPAPPTATSLAGYFDIENTSEEDIVIVSSSSPQFATTMIHDTVQEDGMASMQHRDELRIPAGATISLKPLSTHMMLMQPAQSLPAGSMVEVTLVADDGRVFSQTVEVKPQPE